MYGLPDSAILGTAKRVKTGIVGRRRIEETDNGEWSLPIYIWLQLKKRKDRKKRQEAKRNELERKHKVRFTDK